MRNTLGDLHNNLMEELEKLAMADGEELDTEIKRAQAMSGIAKNIVDNSKTMLTAVNTQYEMGATVDVPRMLTDGQDK